MVENKIFKLIVFMVFFKIEVLQQQQSSIHPHKLYQQQISNTKDPFDRIISFWCLINPKSCSIVKNEIYCCFIGLKHKLEIWTDNRCEVPDCYTVCPSFYTHPWLYPCCFDKSLFFNMSINHVNSSNWQLVCIQPSLNQF